MNSDPALTVGELAALAGPSTVRTFADFWPLEEIASATVNGSPTTSTIAQLAVSGVTTGWQTIVKPGMIIKIYTGSTVRGWFRVRKAPDSDTVLYLMETARSDPGAYAIPLHNFIITHGDTIKIYRTPTLFTIIPRIVYAGEGLEATIYEDYNKSYSGENTTPKPIINITAKNLRTYQRARHLSCLIDPDGTTATIEWTVEVLGWPTSGSSTFTYSWSYSEDFDNVIDEDDTTLTADVPPGNYWIEVTVTDSVAGAFGAVALLWVHDEGPDALYPPLDIARIASDDETTTGRTISLELLSDDFAAIADGVFFNVWDDATWNDTYPEDNTFTTQTCGFLTRYSLQANASGVRRAVPTLVSPLQALEALGAYSQVFTRISSPAAHQQVITSCATLHYAIYAIMRERCANLLKFFNYTPYSRLSASARFYKLEVPEAGSMAAQLQDLAKSYRLGQITCQPDGSMWHKVHPSMRYDRINVITRATLTEDIISAPFEASQEKKPTTRYAQADGFWNDGAGKLPTPYRSGAPAEGPGQGTRDEKVEKLILDNGQSELDIIVGEAYAAANNPIQPLPVKIVGNFAALTIAQMPFVELDISAVYMPDGNTYTRRFIPKSQRRTYRGSGVVEYSMQLEAETDGFPGIPIPLPGAQLPYGVPLEAPPGVPLQPFVRGMTPGHFVAAHSPTILWRTFEIDNSSPDWEDFSPSGGMEIKHFTFDVQEDRHKGLYTLLYDASNSYVAYTENAGEKAFAWTLGATLTGQYYKVVSFKGKPGHILAWSYGVGGYAKVAYSTDYGATWSAPVAVAPDDSVSGGGLGFDATFIDTYSYAAGITASDATQRVHRASTLGGAYSSVGGLEENYGPACIYVPRYQWGSTAYRNRGSHFMYGVSDVSLTASGTVFRVASGVPANITPINLGVRGTPVSMHAFAAWRGRHLIALTYHKPASTYVPYLNLSFDEGTTWIQKTAFSAYSIRPQHLSPDGMRWLAAYTALVKLSTDGGRTWSDRVLSASGNDLKYAEFYG